MPFSVQYIISWYYPCHPFTPVLIHFSWSCTTTFLLLYHCVLSLLRWAVLFFWSVSHYLLWLSVSSIDFIVLALCYFSSCLAVFVVVGTIFFPFSISLSLDGFYVIHSLQYGFIFLVFFICMSLFFHSVYHYLLMLSASSIHYSVLALCLSSTCIVVFAVGRLSFFFNEYLNHPVSYTHLTLPTKA